MDKNKNLKHKQALKAGDVNLESINVNAEDLDVNEIILKRALRAEILENAYTK